MFERLTDGARRVMVLASEEARLLHHGAIGTEHLLLALLADGEGAAARALAPSVTLAAARAQVETLVGRGPHQPVGDIPFTPPAKEALTGVLREAQERGSADIGTGHVLLGLLRDDGGKATTVLRQLGVDLAAVRERAERLAGEEGPASGIRSWTGSDPMDERVARARERVQAERDRAAEKGPGGWEVLAHVGDGALRVLAAARNHTAEGLRGELATVDLIVGVLAVGDPAVREALAEAGVEDPSPGRIAPGYQEGGGGDNIVVTLSGQARRAASMAVRLAAHEGACMTPTHLLLAALEMLGPVRAAVAAERLGSDEAALRPVLLRRIVGLAEEQAATPLDGMTPTAGAMFDRFTDGARRAMVLAQEEAARLGHDNIGTEHLLLGLASEGKGVAARSLDELGVTLPRVREQVEALMGRGAPATDTGIPFTPRARKVLEFSLREAVQHRHNVIGTEHLLLGLTRQREAVAARVLDQLGTDLSRVRSQVLQRLEGPPAAEPAAEPAPGARAEDQDSGWALLARGAEPTWRALVLARRSAAGHGHGAVEVGDLVAGALGTGDPQVREALAAAGAGAAADAGTPSPDGAGDPPALLLSGAARDACARAVEFAGEGASTILPAHLLLGALPARESQETEELSQRLHIDVPEFVTHLARDHGEGPHP